MLGFGAGAGAGLAMNGFMAPPTARAEPKKYRSIKDLDKAEVLTALYLNATFEGEAYADMPPMALRVLHDSLAYARQNKAQVLAAARKKIQAGETIFHSIDLGYGDTPLEVDLSGDRVSVARYNEIHGELACELAIASVHQGTDLWVYAQQMAANLERLKAERDAPKARP